MKLDLGSGENPREGYEGVDLYAENAKWKVNLLEFPWPWKDNSVQAIHCSHFIEHIPMCYANGWPIPSDENDKDLLVRFFDECWRILPDGGELNLIWPALQSVRAFQDPSHRRFIPIETLNYFSKLWREANKLGHYLGKCDFAIMSAGYTPTDQMLKNGEFYSQEAANNAVSHHWNLTLDYIATLKAIKTCV